MGHNSNTKDLLWESIPRLRSKRNIGISFLFALRLFLFERKSFTHGLRVANAALFAEAESVLSLKGSCVCEANEAPFQRNEGCTFDAERLYQLSYRPIIYIGKIYEVDYGPRGSKPLK